MEHGLVCPGCGAGVVNCAMRRLTLKSRLIAACLLPMILLAMVVASTAVYVTRSAVISYSNDDLLQLSREYAAVVESWFNVYETRCLSLKSWFERHAMSNEQIFDNLKMIYDMQDGQSSLSFSSVDGIVYYGNGQMYESTVSFPATRLRDAAGIAQNEIKYFPPHNDYLSGRPVLPFQVPVHNPDGSLRGTITETISLDGLKDIIRSIRFGDTGRVFLVDDNSFTLLAHPELEYEGKSILDAADNLYLKVNTLTAGVAEYNDEGVEKTISTAKLERQNLTLVLEMKTSEVAALVNQQIYPIITITMGMLLLLVMISYFVIRYLYQKLLSSDISEVVNAKLIFESLLEVRSVSFVLTNSQGEIIYAGAMLADMLGMESWRELVGRRIDDVITTAPTREYIKSVLAGTAAAPSMLTQVHDENGHKYWWHITAKILSDERQRTNFLFLMSDETEDMHKLSILDAIMNSEADNAFGIYDVNNRAEYLASRTARALGYEDWHEAIGMDFYHMEKLGIPRAMLDEMVAQVKAGNSIRPHTFVRYAGSREDRWYTVTALPLFVQGDYAGFMIIADNITEILDVQRKLEKALKVKSDFLANMSHEIRTPMNAIIGMTDLLSLAKLGKAETSWVQSISRSAKNLMVLVDDILDISHIDSNDLRLNVLEYDVNSLINDVVSIAHIKAVEKGLSLVVDIAPDIPNVMLGDEQRIKQILSNLLDNAVKYSKAGIVKFSAQAQTLPVPGQVRVCFVIEDANPGIAEETINHLLEMFENEDANISHKEAGFGLGLALSLSLARLMQGDIKVTARPGLGSVFTFSVEQSAASDQPLARVEDVENKSLLMYSMDPDHSEALLHMAAQLRLTCRLCADKDEFIALLHSGQYSHALVDVAANDNIFMFIAKAPFSSELFVLGDLNHHIPENIRNRVNVAPKPLLVNTLAQIMNDSRFDRVASDRNSEQVFTSTNAVVLVVDDNMVNIQVAGNLLRLFNITVDSAYSGQEAIDRVANRHYDLIFMDHMMPEMDGVEATKIIRRMPGCEDLVIIALSANVVAGTRELFLDSGMQDSLSKPIIFKQLSEMLKKWLPPEKIILTEPGQEADQDNDLAYLKQKLHHINGLDLDELFVRNPVGADDYLGLLKTFTLVAGQAENKLTLYQEENRPDELRIEIHGMKSALANIGAFPLSEEAKNMENEMLKGNLSYVNHSLSRFVKELNRLSGLIKQSLPNAGAMQKNDQKSEIKPFELGQVVVNIKRLIEAYEGDDAVDALNRLRGQAEPAIVEKLDKVIEHLELFDYARAANELEEIDI